MEPPVAPMFDGPIDVIGDVHGEFDALRSLLDRLGYDAEGNHRDRRRLVFVGDLIDRGPDSPAVLRLVETLVRRGRAQCVMGNHELNALRNDPHRRRAGEDWWYGRPERVPVMQSCLADAEEKQRSFLPFLRTLPVALERPDLRVVHAAWHRGSIDAVLGHTTTLDAYTHHEAAQQARLVPLVVAAELDKRGLGITDDTLRDPRSKVPYLSSVATHDEVTQMGNPVRVLTSGIEQDAGRSYWAEKWRMTERVAWWDHYAEEVPVVVGHYWRRYDPRVPHPKGVGADLFDDTSPDVWLGPKRRVTCIDYSVGYRYAERAGLAQGRHYALGGLRVPQWRVEFDDGRPALALGEPGGSA